MMAPQPICILIGALGGEGGGALTRWLVQAARASGYAVQATSIPGVAQRTGATTYYIEIVPIAVEHTQHEQFSLALSPVPGQIDLFIASELVEAGRAAQAGLISPDRTVLIASTHRVYTVAEKAAMGDGRFDTIAIQSALQQLTKKAILFDMAATAREAGTIISAIMYGAIAGSQRLPISPDVFEHALRASEQGTQASLNGFAAGLAAVTSASATERVRQAGLNLRPIPQHLNEAVAGIEKTIPPSLRPLVEEGYMRLVDYQDRRYAALYLSRVQQVLAAEKAANPAEFPATAAYARFAALWMSYEDVIRVAALKGRRSRIERIRKEVGATEHDVVRVTEFLKPGIEEWCSVLPPGMARRVRARADKHGDRSRFSRGLYIATTSLHGIVLLRLLASLRWWRPRTARYLEEQALIERWTRHIIEALMRDHALAVELALCGRLIKGYGDTHARGKTNFLRILDTLLSPSGQSQASAIREAREAALADPEGRALDKSLSTRGIPPRAPTAKPIVWHKRKPAA